MIPAENLGVNGRDEDEEQDQTTHFGPPRRVAVMTALAHTFPVGNVRQVGHFHPQPNDAQEKNGAWNRKIEGKKKKI